MSQLSQQQKNSYFAWFVCSLGALFYCYEYYLRITPSVISDQLIRFHQLNAASFGNLSAFYYYAYTPTQLVVGILFDRFGVRRLLFAAIACCAIGSYLFALPVLWIAHCGRFLVGFGSAFAFVGALKLATIWLPPQRLALVSGLVTMLGMLGAILGDVTLGYLVKHWGWQTTIDYAAMAGVMLAIIVWLVVRDDLPVVAGSIKWQKAKQKVQRLSSLREGIAGLSQLSCSPMMWLNGLIGSLLYLSLDTFAELWGTPYLRVAHHLDTAHAANLNALVFFGWAVGSPLVGILAGFLTKRHLQLLGALLSAADLAILLYVPSLPTWTIGILLFLLGILTSVEILVFVLAREFSPEKLSATAISLTNMFVMLGGMLLQPIVGILLQQHSTGMVENGVPIYSLADYQFALMVLPLGMLLAGLLAFFLPKTPANC